ncbi:hypothetical protein QTP86_022416 [Hemibagrus guttatus]|nr:hypothetical protein QTP86_022416 [Hemibagrus guttatus]
MKPVRKSWTGTRSIARQVGGSEKHGEANGGGARSKDEADGGKRGTKAKQVGGARSKSETGGGSTGPDGKAKPRDVHHRAEAPSDDHSRAAEPSDVHCRVAAPSDVHRRATTPSDVQRRTTAPSDELCPAKARNSPRGIKAGYTLDGVPTHSDTTDNLEMPINLQCMSLDQGEETGVPGGNPEARGEHANSTHTRGRWEANPQPWRCEANVLPTKPPCSSTPH